MFEFDYTYFYSEFYTLICFHVVSVLSFQLKDLPIAFLSKECLLVMDLAF